MPGEDIDRLISGIRGKQSHKKSIERDVLLIDTARMTGFRRDELHKLNVGDLCTLMEMSQFSLCGAVEVLHKPSPSCP